MLQNQKIVVIMPAKWLRVFLCGLLLLLVVSVLILSSVPPVSRDALTHHLAIPKLYIDHGGVYRIPDVIFSYYPMNLELLYLIPLYFGKDIIPKFIHFGFALLTAALMFCYLKKRLNMTWALLGALIFLSIPVIVRLSISAYVDLGLVFFSTAALLYLLQWIENDFKIRKLVWSALFCGLALGTKYNGLVVLAMLALFVPFIFSRNRGGGFYNSAKSFGLCGLYLMVALIVFAPWMIRNYIWTQNPIYPLYNTWFKGSPNSPETPARPPEKKLHQPPGGTKSRPPLGLFAYRQIAYQESWLEIATVPVRIFFQGRDDNPRYFDGRLNPFLFFLPLLALVGRSTDPPGVKMEKKILACFSFLFLMITFFKVEMRIRYLAPILPALVILSIFGLDRIMKWLKHWPARLSGGSLAVIAGLFLGLNLVYLAEQFKKVDPIPYIRGQISRDRYIENNWQEYPLDRFVNGNLSSRAVILRFFLGNRIYYCNRKTIPGPALFLQTVKHTDAPERVLDGLIDRGITHLIIRHDLFNEWLNNNFDEKQHHRVILFFQNHTRLLYHKNGYGLYAL